VIEKYIEESMSDEDFENYLPPDKNPKDWDNFTRDKQISLLKKYTEQSLLAQPLLLFHKGKLKSAVFKRMKANNLFFLHIFYKHFRRDDGGSRREKYVTGVWNERSFFYKRTHGWTLAYIEKYRKRYLILAASAGALLLWLIFRKNKKTT
jgi:hypothetical protein